MKRVLISLIFLLLLVGSCGEDTKKVVEKPDGSEGGPCYGNGSCDGDLVCENDICVSPEELSDTDTGNTGNTGNSGNSGDTGDTGNSGDTGGDDTVVPDDDSETVVDNEHPDVDNYSPKCGNNILDEGEFCEVGEKIECSDIEGESYPEGKYTVCKSDCSGWRDTLCGTCGNSVKDPDETCDAGVVIDCSLIPDKGYKAGITATCNDTCSGWNDEEECALTTCGDGILDKGETCEKGTITDCSMIPGKTYVSGTTATCNDICTGWNDIIVCSLCGNGILDFGEECDDGNTSNNDDCKNDCTQNVCGDTYIRAGKEECDDGNSSNNDACLNSCKLNICGDGYVKTGEECDDGNSSNNDECLNSCKLNICGDGYIKTGEECDDGNLINNDGCDINCTFTGCGNGIVTEGEECDDGNSINDDGCTNNCEIYIDAVKAKFIGTWAQKIILKSTSSTSLVMNVPSVTTRYIISEIKLDNDGNLALDRKSGIMCRTDNRTGDSALNKGVVGFNEPNSKFNTIYHFWKPSQIPGQETVPDIEVTDNGTDILFKTNKEWELRGANMTNPSTEELPKKDEDAKIFDHDVDTKAAFTITFSGFVNGPIYYVQRLTAIFDGKLVSEGKIEGNVDWTDEQYVHQSTPNITLKGQKTTITYKDKSVFQFVKVDDNMDCATLIANINGANDIFDIVDPNTDVPN